MSNPSINTDLFPADVPPHIVVAQIEAQRLGERRNLIYGMAAAMMKNLNGSEQTQMLHSSVAVTHEIAGFVDSLMEEAYSGELVVSADPTRTDIAAEINAAHEKAKKAMDARSAEKFGKLQMFPDCSIPECAKEGCVQPEVCGDTE